MVWLNNLLLKTPSPQLRRKAIENLTGSGNSRDTERFVASMQDKNPQVRCAAVRALERVNHEDSRRSLVAALQDPSYQVREAAARALGRLRAAGCAGPLAACLKEPDPAVRAAVAGALRALGWKPTTTEELARFEIALGNTPAAIPVREAEAVPYDTAFLRRAAAEAFKEMNDPRKVKSLFAALHVSDRTTRISAIRALEEVTNEAVTGELLKL